MNHPDVPFMSVVIPTYNRRELLKDAIESLFSQSYPKDHYEIIIIDNSSTDATGELAQALQQKFEGNLRYYCKENEGPGSARNLGIKKAQGSIVAFMDSDCVADKNWLENGLARMDDGIGIVQGKTLPNPKQPQRTLQHTMKVLSEDSFYPTCNILYRKVALDLVGGFSPEFCGLNFLGKQKGGEDTDLAWKVKKTGWRSVFADDAVVYHHIFPLSSPKALIGYIRFNIIVAIALVVKKHPELRDAILYRKVFKSKQRALFYILVFAMFPGSLIHWSFFFFGLPYVTRLLKVIFYKRSMWSYHRGLALLGLTIFVELVESILSIYVSLVYGTVIL